MRASKDFIITLKIIRLQLLFSRAQALFIFNIKRVTFNIKEKN